MTNQTNPAYITEPAIEHYAYQYSKPESELLQELVHLTEEKFPGTTMVSGHLVGKTLALLCQLLDARTILEIGTFTGYSALAIAEACAADAKIICIDKDPVASSIAKNFFSQVDYGNKIYHHLGEAVNLIDQVSKHQPFDLVFIDADKNNYVNYYHACLPLLRQGGLMVFDNALWYGKVLNPQKTTDHSIHQLNTLILADRRVDNVLLPVRDGLNILRKR